MSSADGWAVDTSVAVAALDSGHLAHAPCREAVRELRPALAGHASFEVYSVLTRLPGTLAIDPGDAAHLMRRTFPRSVWLDAEESQSLLDNLAPLGITGGAVYDALVGVAARSRALTLLTRDMRARRTYDLLGVTYRFVD